MFLGVKHYSNQNENFMQLYIRKPYFWYKRSKKVILFALCQFFASNFLCIAIFDNIHKPLDITIFSLIVTNRKLIAITMKAFRRIIVKYQCNLFLVKIKSLQTICMVFTSYIFSTSMVKNLSWANTLFEKIVIFQYSIPSCFHRFKPNVQLLLSYPFRILICFLPFLF